MLKYEFGLQEVKKYIPDVISCLKDLCAKQGCHFCPAYTENPCQDANAKDTVRQSHKNERMEEQL